MKGLTLKSIIYSSKYKLVALLIIAASALALATSSTIAFFTDARESAGVFTAGSVYIELTEAAVKPDERGNLVEDTSRDRVAGAEISEGNPLVVHNYGVVFPGQTIHKDPTIKNTGSEDAWVALKVIIEDGNGDIYKLYGYDNGTDDIDIKLLLSGGLLDERSHIGEWNGIQKVHHNDNYAMLQSSNRSAGRYEFYFIMQKPLESGETVEVFDTLTMNEFFGNNEMQEFRDFKVTIQAFAVQKFGFATGFEAMREAFSDRFSVLS